MWHKVADGVYAIEGLDGLPIALMTTLDDGMPLRVAEQWWAGSRRLLEWAKTDAGREWLRHLGEPGGSEPTVLQTARESGLTCAAIVSATNFGTHSAHVGAPAIREDGYL